MICLPFLLFLSSLVKLCNLCTGPKILFPASPWSSSSSSSYRFIYFWPPVLTHSIYIIFLSLPVCSSLFDNTFFTYSSIYLTVYIQIEVWSSNMTLLMLLSLSPPLCHVSLPYFTTVSTSICLYEFKYLLQGIILLKCLKFISFVYISIDLFSKSSTSLIFSFQNTYIHKLVLFIYIQYIFNNCKFGPFRQNLHNNFIESMAATV
jgi:hypothetical protein